MDTSEMFARIEAGTFIMGSPASEPCRSSNEDLHRVTLTHPFEIAITETTQRDFQALLRYNPSCLGSSGCGDPGFRGRCSSPTCPVENASWHEAVAYCNALSTALGKARCYACAGSGERVRCEEAPAFAGRRIYSCLGYRLPTEAEWEYAYRAGSQTALYNGAIRSCSQDANADLIGWYTANADKTTHPVGKKKPNGWGLHDIAGNVGEWCHDWFQLSLGSSKVTDPVGAGSSDRVCRGGSWRWNSNAGYLRAADRSALAPAGRASSLGFRCVRTLTSSAP